MGKFCGFCGDYEGLKQEEVKSRQEKHGKNEFVAEKKEGIFSKILSTFTEPMFLLLLCTSFIYFILGEPRDGTIMLVFIAFMSGIEFFQEWRTDKTLKALKELSDPRVRVIREGLLLTIDSIELTVGDLMIVEEGEKISADGCILEMFDLGVDESTLTGESEVVWKKVNISEDEKSMPWRKDYCYAGTTVTQGCAVVEVAAIGKETEYGKIGQDILSAPDRPTPLEKQTDHLIKVCAGIGLGLFVLVFLATYFYTKDLIDSLLSGITLAMAIIPEEFPVILTVFLAMGAWRLAKKNSLVRRMPSVETLGAVSVLCVDKTGTLTENRMTLQETYCFGGTIEKELLHWATLACETEPYDPMEKAILTYAENKGINKQELFENKLLLEYPFSSEKKMMGHVWEIGELPMLAAKGSPESILALCNLNEEEKGQIEEEQRMLAAKGYRVIAIAKMHKIDAIPENLEDNVLDFLGLVGLEDPPREKVSEAIKVCGRAGIRVVMITGDNGLTAQSIARKIGLQHTENVITGKELENMSDGELREKVKETNIFARVIPKHKMRIVKALKEVGEIVAMTGDGVNDAPALKYADIGIAMGQRGTGVAKEAADMILLDDNFTTIVDTIKDGRRIYDNIKKAIGYVFVIHIPIALTALLTPLLHLPALLLPIHVVLLELIIDPTCSIVFERQPAEKDIMDRGPRQAKAPLVTKGLVIKSVLQGLVILVASFGSYAYLGSLGMPEEIGRTFTIIVLGFANLFLVYANQSETELGILAVFKFKEKIVWYVNAAVVAALLLIVYTPAGNSIAKTMPLSFREFAAAVGLAALSIFWWDIVKVIKRITPRIKTHGQV